MTKLLSLCMIVKNEEKVLARCLESVQGIADEIIVIDTGSTDRTKEIALQYTPHVHDFVWVNDFAMAKNEAIRHATSKWILVLDADEYLDREHKDRFLRDLASWDSGQPIGYVLTIYNFIDPISSGKFLESTAIRLFPNHPDVYFDRPIHEQVVLRDGELPTTYYPLTLYHTGYLAETKKEKEKSARNMNIFKDLKSSKSFSEYDYFTLANEYSMLRDHKKALYYYERSLTKKTEKMSIFPYVRYQIVLVLVELRRYKDALQYVEDNLKRWPHHPDYYTIRGNIYESLGLYEEAIEDFKTAIDKAEHSRSKDGKFWLMTPSLGSHVPMTGLANLYLKAQNIPQGVYYLTKLVQMNSNDYISLIRLLSLLQLHETTESILSFLGKIFKFEQTDHLAKLLHVALLLNSRELSDYFYKACQLAEVPIQPHQELYYAVILGDRARFDSHLGNIGASSNKSQVNKLLFLAAIIWKDSQYGQYLSDPEDDGAPAISLLHEMFTTLEASFDPAVERAFDVNYIVTLLIDLFQMGYYDDYDSLIARYPAYSNILANLLGDYFYNQHQYQLGLDYYSLLLNQDQLAGPGYYFLSQLYINQNELEDGLAFLAKAIDAVPQQFAWYVRYFQVSPDSSERERIVAAYRKEFPSYAQIPAIINKLKGRA